MSKYKIPEKVAAFFRGLIRLEPLLEVAVTGLKKSGVTEKNESRYAERILGAGVRLKLDKKRAIEILEILKVNPKLNQENQMKLGIALNRCFDDLERKDDGSLQELATAAYRVLLAKNLTSAIAEKTLVELIAKHGSFTQARDLLENEAIRYPDNLGIVIDRVTNMGVESLPA